jgi:hypothetical protein
VQYTPSTLGGSGYFDGSGDYLTVASNAQTAFQSNNFTIEFWVYLTNASANALQTLYSNYTIFASAGSIYFGKHTNNSGAVTVWFSNYSTGGPLLAESTLPPNNQWVHYALVRNGNTFSLYRNGALSTSSTAFTGAATGTTNPNYIFAAGDAVTSYNPPGYLTDFRIVNGTAVYTGAFTPPTAPLTPVTNTQLLLSTNNAAIFDNSGMSNLETVGNAQIDTSVVKYGTGSMYFDGSGDYLTYASTPNLAYGSGEFTVELWVYLNAAPGGDAGLVDQRPASTNGSYFMLGVDSSRRLFVYVSSAYRIGPTVAINTATWYHVAYVRTSGTGTLYLNGSSIGSWADTTTYAQSSGFIGHHAFNAADFNGYMDDLRITKGVARYVTNFTPPVARMPNQ